MPRRTSLTRRTSPTRRTSLTVLLASLLSVVLMTGTASAATVEASWRFDEPAGSRVAVDSAYGQNGTVGTDVQTGVVDAGVTAYRWKPFAGGWQAYLPERLITVAESNRLDPGTGTFAVTVRFRTSATGGNIAQKGQTGTWGGHWKIELFRGFVRCQFQDSAKTIVGITSSLWVDNYTWNEVTCERNPTGVAVVVDGVRKTKAGTLGKIDNKLPMTVGGKSKCDGVRISCDYFVGDIDSLVITKG